MAKSKRKLREEAKRKKEARNFFRVVAVSTGVILVLLYFMFANS